MDGADSPFLLPSSSSSSSSLHHSVKRTGSLWTAVAHIITGVIGSGVLSLAWSMAQLGWIAGPLSMLFFALITAVSAFLLSDTYRSPDPEFGTIRNRSYIDAVRFNLGDSTAKVCGLFVYVSLYGCAIAYTITSATSMRAIQKSNCYHSEGHQAACKYGHTEYMLLFGAFQLFMSQIPNFHEMEWLSVVAAVMSCVYSSVGLGLGLAKTIGDKKIKGSISGVAASSVIKKVWLVAQALGDIAFAYPYSLILLEIQDTLKSPPPENETMKKASTISISITTLFYLSCGGFGYAAFGDDTPGNLLTGFGFYEPYWLIDLANACIVVHLVGGYQIYSQPVFGAIDRWLMEKYPDSKFINHDHILNLPFLPGVRLNLSKLCYRSIYVASSTAIAMLFPYFNQVLGVLGGLNFWPVAIYFPVEMYLVQKNVARWSAKWVLLQIFSAACFSVTLFALVGSIEGVLAEKLS
uniref:Amino acid transporter transmembrane domain-containing protein n=1 Tax=Kalanchoe fedtschenkoi TaxID=63787 RepID=A0A7N0ZZ11_KALFE